MLDTTGSSRRYPTCKRQLSHKFGQSGGISGFTTHVAAELNLKQQYSRYQRENEYLQQLDWKSSMSALAMESKSFQARQFFTAIEHLEDPVTGELSELHPLAFAVKAADADNPNWSQATQGENSDGFWTAMFGEITTLSKLKAWDQIERTRDMHVLPSTWAFKVKRYPSGLVRKLKARMCVRGDQQQAGIDFFESYAPVVQWATVRTLLILSVILSLKSMQVDYTAAFCQADIDTDVYVSLPRGWRELNRLGLTEPFKDNHVLKLNRSLYGLVQSPRNFFLHLKSKLETTGFEQSSHDPCLFISSTVVCLVYVDDCLFFSRSDEDIKLAITRLRDNNMDLNVEDDVAGFLGVHIDKNEKGQITLTQLGLIDRIVEALGLHDCNAKFTPAPTEALGRDVDGLAHTSDFNYASVVGMLSYLSNNSRPDISFAVNQCARHTHHPTERHAKYIKHIGKYLKGTRDKGLILKPKRIDALNIDCYVDADFAGLWNAEDVHDPHCVRSRMGYVIAINGCPIVWKSKLLSEITLSTMETEYVALSHAARALLPLQRIVKEVSGSFELEAAVPKIKSTIWEDNQAALKLANLELLYMTSRSKHIAIKYHWFCSHSDVDWSVMPISTKEQIADIFTKGLPTATFEYLRFLLMGW